jgi:hypothetical protein
MNLCRRGILRAEKVVCPVCGALGESTTHLFLHCNLDIVAIVPLDVIMSYGHMVISGRNKRIRKGYAIVWLALIWVLWRMCNDRVFNNNIGTMADAMDQIQRLSWQWFLSKTTKDSCLFYEWIWDPGECLMRG